MTSQSYCALLLLCTVASSFLPLATGTQCVDSLPDFRNTGHLQREGLSNGIAAVIPAYNFSCTGRVKQWRAHVERRRNRYDRYKLTFSVWRQTSSSDDCEYQLVGENAHSGLAPELGDNDTALGTVTLNVSAEEQIVVRPGDFVGFKVEHYEVAWPSGRWLGAGAASIMVDLEQTDVLVWNKQLPFDQTCLRERDLDRETEHYSGVFEPTPLPAAPVIAVMVESGKRPSLTSYLHVGVFFLNLHLASVSYILLQLHGYSEPQGQILICGVIYHHMCCRYAALKQGY